jgi:demethylmenaquinone methyltransferase/2-methoxy-6-polyprenyl-1,4-benzoquinol methylase
MASMFDDVSGRYELINQVMSLGQVDAWRRALASAVPENAPRVLDLCTGNGASLEGLRRPGRLVLGADVSLGMLREADALTDPTGWTPRLVCADAFKLPLRDGAVAAVTVAFGMRNLRPMSDALAEIARVLAPGGVLAVLEATAPAPGPLAGIHRFHLKHGVPLIGRLSPDPSAYRYLGESILEFGDGTRFEEALAAAGFTLRTRRRFMLGCTGLWVAERRGEKPSERSASLQDAREGGPGRGEFPQTPTAEEREWRTWNAVQLVLAMALTLSLTYALWMYIKLNADLPLAPWQRALGWLLLIGGTAGFAIRSVVLARRLGGRGRRR